LGTFLETVSLVSMVDETYPLVRECRVMGRELFGQVEIVPGIVGPERVTYDSWSVPTVEGGIDVELDVIFDPVLRRYVCVELVAKRHQPTPNADGTYSTEGRYLGHITTDHLTHIRIADVIQIMLLVMNDPGAAPEDRAIRQLPNPDNIEPWGFKAPEGLSEEGPTDRTLRWTAHLYRYGLAIEYNPTKSVEESLGVPRSTAGRWIAKARERGYLEPAEGQGRAGG
jgi:hypothetical protein